MRDVAHFVPFTEANRAAEVVLYDPEVIAVVVDVGGQLRANAPTDDALLAEPRSLPVHFQLQLIGLHEPRRLAEPFAELTEEEEKPVSLSLVIAQRGIHRGMRTAVDRPARQRQGGIAIPILGEGAMWCCKQEQERSRPAHCRPI